MDLITPPKFRSTEQAQLFYSKSRKHKGLFSRTTLQSNLIVCQCHEPECAHFYMLRTSLTWINSLGHGQVESVQSLGPVQRDDPFVVPHCEHHFRTFADKSDSIKFGKLVKQLKNSWSLAPS